MILCIKSLFTEDMDFIVKWAKYVNIIGLILTIIMIIGFFTLASACKINGEGFYCTLHRLFGNSNNDNKPKEYNGTQSTTSV